MIPRLLARAAGPRRPRPACSRRPPVPAPRRVRARVPRRWSDEAGQGLTEYVIIAALILGSLTVMSFTILPDFIHAIQIYYDSFYVVLNLPIP